MAELTAKQQLLGMVQEFAPQFSALAALHLQSITDDQAAQLLPILDAFKVKLEAGQGSAALNDIETAFPQVAPMLRAFGVRAVIDAATANAQVKRAGSTLRQDRIG